MQSSNKTIFLCRGLLLFIILISAQSLSFAQDNPIKGRVVDFNNNEAISYATIVLQTADSVFVDGTTSDSLGNFNFNHRTKAFRLLISHVSYNDTLISSSNNNIGTIKLKSKARLLSDLVVVAQKPILRVKNGVLSYDVQKIQTNSAVNNAYELIKHIPGVNEIDGKLTLAGSESLTVIINGRASTMSQSQLISMLQQMSASQLLKADVLYSAPPELHVRGAAINISMKKSGESNLLQGEFSSSLSKKHYINYTLGTSLFYSSKNFSFDFLYAYQDAKAHTGMEIISNHDIAGTIHKINKLNNGYKNAKTHTARLGLDYKLNPNNTISFAYNLSLYPNANGYEQSKSNLFSSTNQYNKKNQLHNLSLNLSNKKGFSVGLDYSIFKNPIEQTFQAINAVDNTEKYFNSKSAQDINKISIYIANKHSLKNGLNLRYGGRYDYTYDVDFQEYSNVNGFENLFKTENTIKESIYNLYFGVAKQFTKQFSFDFSLSGEYSLFDKEKDFTIFPQMNLSYTVSPKKIFQFSLSSDKIYPKYWEKQKFVGQADAYSQIQGNPALMPYQRYNANLRYIMNQKYVFSAYCSSSPKFFSQQVYQSPDELTLIYKSQNWDYYSKIGINIVIPIKLSNFLNSNFVLNSFYHNAKSDKFFDLSFNRHRFTNFFSLDNNFKISSKPDIRFNLMAYYMHNPMQGIYDLSNVFNLNMGLKMSFAQNRATLILKVTDLFARSMPNMRIRYDKQNLDMNISPDIRALTLSFSYSFGNYKKREHKTIDDSRFGH